MAAPRHIIYTQDFEKEWVHDLFEAVDESKAHFLGKRFRELHKVKDYRSVALLFYEASTRTSSSFFRAAEIAGISPHNPGNMKEFSSAIKGETLEHTIRVYCGQLYDFVVLRHNEEGAAYRAAAVADAFEKESGHRTVIINAGDGPGQHPTQALLDLYTLREHFKEIDNLRIVIGGDLRYGRTCRSLVYLLTKFGTPRFVFTSPKDLSLSDDIRQYLTRNSVPFKETFSLDEALEIGAGFEGWYWTRAQIERQDLPEEVRKRIKAEAEHFTLRPKHLERMSHQTILLHPLPINGEIEIAVQDNPRAWYFKQCDNGIPVRKALFDAMLPKIQAN